MKEHDWRTQKLSRLLNIVFEVGNRHFHCGKIYRQIAEQFFCRAEDGDQHFLLQMDCILLSREVPKTDLISVE